MRLSFTRTYATTVTAKDGRFHPAILTEDGIFYWPNIIQSDEEVAHNLATDSLNRALEQAQRYADEWNVLRSNTGHTL